MSGKRKPGQVYTEAERAEILDYYRTHGGRPTARHFGISTSTLYGWRKTAGVETEVAGKEATAAATATLKLKRDKLKAKLLDRADEMLDWLSPEKRPGPKECWSLATTFKTLLESLRLEGGESTDRREVSHEYPDIAALSDDELEAAIIREAESITRREAEA